MTVTICNDERIARAVRMELALSPRIDAARIGVDVLGGVVRLSGDVRTERERAAIERATRRVRGVNGVDDGTRLAQRELDAADEAIHTAARACLRMLGAHGVNVRGINIRVYDRDIVLTGTVRAPFDHPAITRALAQLPGARSIDDRLEVLRADQPVAVAGSASRVPASRAPASPAVVS